jgi:hypothetical protein
MKADRRIGRGSWLVSRDVTQIGSPVTEIKLKCWRRKKTLGGGLEIRVVRGAYPIKVAFFDQLAVD